MNSETEKRLTVVGIGASAGGLMALQSFFEAIPAESGMAFVVISHMAPDQESLLPELLQRYTAMPVRQVQSPLAIEPDHVYVIPPGLRILMTDTSIDAEPFTEPHGLRRPVDDFYRSLAAAHPNAVTVILSGTGSDGAVGVKAVKETGGLLLVQHPQEAQFGGMPRAAIATGLADVVLPVKMLAQKLLAYHQNGNRLAWNPDQLPEYDQNMLTSILAYVQVKAGYDLSQYKQETLLSRIHRRMRLHDLQTLDGYAAYLRNSPDEARILFNDLLVGVTTFFRTPETWQALADQVIPHLFADKQGGEGIRVWSIGCATGEEAYSLAMLLIEEADRHHTERAAEETVSFQIFASDLDEQALSRARQGVYPDVIEADVSPERLERFFVREGSFYRIRSRVRDAVLFASHSVLYDPPFSRLDLISSRNLLTHLRGPLRQRVLEIFYYALNPGGYLVLDNLDAAEVSGNLFQPLDKEHNIYAAQSEAGEQVSIPSLLSTIRLQPKPPRFSLTDSTPQSTMVLPSLPSIERRHQQSLEALSPPSLLVDETYRVLHLSESAGRYLIPRRGTVSKNLLELVRPELTQELEKTLALSFRRQKAVLSSPVPVHFNGADHVVVISARPHQGEGDSPAPSAKMTAALVFFLEDEVEREREEPAPSGSEQGRIRQLEAEVRTLRARLRSTSEGFMNANEELRGANEELNSTNEEYRAALEELKTNEEELKTVNEELRITNEVLDHKVDEITEANTDLENLMTATDIPTLFLDRDLNIRRFTPAAERLFPLRSHDYGRPLSDLVSQLGYEFLAEDAGRVLESLISTEREFMVENGRWKLMRLQPFRTEADRVAGVVVTFIDITELKKVEAQLRQSQDNLAQNLAQEVAALRHLHEMTGRIFNLSDINQAMDEILRAAVEVLQADFGNIQLLDQQGQNLTIVAHIGFDQSFLDRFQDLGLDDNTACGRSLRLKRRVLIEDVETDPEYEPYLKDAGQGGYRAVQSTPLINNRGQILGVLSTHYRQPTNLSDRDQRLLDLLAYQGANLIERLRVEERLERKVEERTVQVRQLASELVEAEQSVRQRLAQSLHDNLQQTLYAAKVQLQFVREEVGEREELDSLIDTLAHSLQLTRQLTVELSPPILEKEGLPEMLDWLGEHMRELYDLEVTVKIDGRPDTPTEELRILMYQIVRELLFNVVKHSGTMEAVVQLEQNDDGLWITVSDDGIGFDVETGKAEGRAGFGLYSIHERLRLFDGRAEIYSRLNEGTRVRLFLPLVRLKELNEQKE